MAHAPRRRRFWRAVTRLPERFLRQSDGATAVEFGIVAVPFLFLIFAMLETALVFLAGQILETATADAARLIRTGQAQSQNFNATSFKTALCSRIVALIDCNSSAFAIDVRTYQSFGAANLNRPVDQNGNYVGTGTYQPGVGGDIVLVRAFYEFPIMLPTFGVSMSDLPNGKRLLAATAAFRNEPF